MFEFLSSLHSGVRGVYLRYCSSRGRLPLQLRPQGSYHTAKWAKWRPGDRGAFFSLQPHPKIATTTTTEKNIVRRRPGLAFPVEPGLNEGVDCGAVECQEVRAQKWRCERRGSRRAGIRRLSQFFRSGHSSKLHTSSITANFFVVYFGFFWWAPKKIQNN